MELEELGRTGTEPLLLLFETGLELEVIRVAVEFVLAGMVVVENIVTVPVGMVEVKVSRDAVDV